MAYTLDNLIDFLSNKSFSDSDFLSGHTILISRRKHNLQKKPPLYLYDLTGHTYISSLKADSSGRIQSFVFDVRSGEDLIPYTFEVISISPFKYEIKPFLEEKIS